MDTFGRFDKFIAKYNPLGTNVMRNIFLKRDNYLEGRYLAELTREVFEKYSKNPSLKVETRISIYGKSLDEWNKLASWINKYDINFHNNRWLVQIPRNYHILKEHSNIHNFQEMLDSKKEFFSSISS